MPDESESRSREDGEAGREEAPEAAADTASDTDKRGDDIVLPPPSIPVVVMLFSRYLEWHWPLAMPASGFLYWFGLGVAVIGLSLILFVGMRFTRAGTDLRPHKPTSALITDGPFEYSRNPIYVGFLIIQAGVALVLGSFWMLILLPLTFFGLEWLIIRREERYLARKFGRFYTDYRSQVRRWV